MSRDFFEKKRKEQGKNQSDQLYRNMLAQALKETASYARQGERQTRDVANTLVGGGMANLNRGDVKNLDRDTLRTSVIDNAAAVKELSKLGIFNKQEYATDPMYKTLPGTDYLKQMEETLQMQRAASLVADDFAKASKERTAETETRWQQLFNEKDTTDEAAQWYNWLMADYLLGDRDELFDFEKINSKYEAMDDESYYAEEDRLRNQFENLDWETLTGSKTNRYESKTPTYEGYLDTVGGELKRRKAIDELEAMAKANPKYASLSAYNNTYTAPERSMFGQDQYAAYVQGLNNLNRFINIGGTYAEKQVAAEHSPAVAGYLDQGYDYMTDDEIATYNVLYNTDQEKASAYLEALGSDLLYRRAQADREWTETKATNPYLAAPSWIDARINTLVNIGALPLQAYEAATGRDDPYSAAFDAANKAGYVTGAQMEALGDIEMLDWSRAFGKNMAQHLYSGISSAADNALRAATGPTGALALAGAQAASSSLQKSASRGDMSGAAKIVKAMLDAGAEVGTEKVGLDALFDKGKPGALEYIKGVIGAELGEETINYISEDVIEAAVAFMFEHEADIKSAPEFWQGLGETALQTLISSGLMGSGGAIGQASANRATGKQVKTQGDFDAVLDIASGLAPSTQSYQLAQEAKARTGKGKRLSLNKMGQIVHALDRDLSAEQSRVVDQVMDEAIVDRLVELGTDVSTAKKNAPAVRKIANGQVLTAGEKRAVSWDDNASQVVKELAAKESTDQKRIEVEGAPTAEPEGQRAGQKWKSDLGLKTFEKTSEVMEKRSQLADAVSTPVAQDVQMAVEAAEKKTTTRNAKNKNLANKGLSYITAAGEARGEFQRFEMKDGKMQVVVKSGDTETAVKVEDLTDEGGAGTAAIIEYTAMAHHNMTAAEANTMMTAYQSIGGDAKRFIRSFEDVYAAGFAGVNAPPTQLPDNVAQAVYEQAQKDGAAAEENRVAKAKRIRETTQGTVTWLGAVRDNTAIRGKGDKEALSDAMEGMTDSQRTTAEVVKAMAEEMRVNIVLYESTGENVANIANGKYNQDTHTLYIDVNSGAASGRGIQRGKKTNTLGYAMMRTLGHELTHHIEATSADGYAQYKNAVKKQLQEAGQSWATLVREKIDNAAAEGRRLTRMGAEAEVIADASEYMLQESSFTKKLDSGLYAKVKTFVQSFMEKVREIFTHITGEHRESAALRKVVNDVRQYTGNLQQLWDAALGETIQGKSALSETEGNATESVEELEQVEQFSMGRDVEVRSDGLMAVHNIKGPELENTLKLGGFPMPSIAIIKAKEGHTMYGEYSVIFGKETIDPRASAKNRVYGADAWTPVFPRTETEVLDDVMYDRENESRGLAAQVDEEYGKKVRTWFSRFGGSDTTAETMDDLQNSAWNNDGMLAAYMTAHGKTVQILEKDVEVNRGYNPARADMYDHILDIVDLLDLVDMKAHALIDKYGDRLAEEIPRPFARLNANWKQGDMQAGVRMVEIFKQATAYEGSGRDTSVKAEKAKDYYATGDAMRSSIDRADFNEWIKGKLQDAFGAQGIYNGKERFTPSGNRRSFKQLHDPVTAANVVKVMAAQQESDIPATDAKGLMAAASSMYKSIAEIKADADRLGKISDEEYNARIAAANNTHHDLLNAIEAWDYIQIEEVGDLLVQAAKKRMDASAIAELLKRNGYKATQKAGKLAADLIRQVQTIPSGYFEAKPARVVGFDEIKMIIAPESMPEALATKLDGLGIPYMTYDGTDADRMRKANAVEGAQFSMRDAYGNEFAMAEKDIEDNKRVVANMQPIVRITGNRFAKQEGKDFKTMALEYFGEEGTTAQSELLGPIAIDKAGIEHLISSLTWRRSALLPAIKPVIENGRIIQVEKNHKGYGFDTALIAGVVSLDGRDYYMGVAVRERNDGSNGYYIHDAVMAEKRSHLPNKSGLVTAGEKAPTLAIILADLANYNTQFEEEEQFSSRDLPDTVSIRDYLGAMKPTSRMTETEKDLLGRYQKKLTEMQEKERLAEEQDEIIKTAPATSQELLQAKNRYQVYRQQANRIARELAKLERAEGFAGLMATSQTIVNEYLSGATGSVADAQDALETEIKGLTDRLKVIGNTVEGTAQGQRNAFARGLFNQTDLNRAAKMLKDSYNSRMSVKTIADRMALAYGEIYASEGAEGAKRFAAAAKELAQDILNSSRYRYRSETLSIIAEELPTISLTETDQQEIKNAGMTITEYKRGLSPYVKVAEGASDLSSYVSNAEAYGGQIGRILGDDAEGNLAMALYNVIQAERVSEATATLDGMSESESLGAVLADVVSANMPMSTSDTTMEYLRKELKKYAGENEQAAQSVDAAIKVAKGTTAKASAVWREAVKAQGIARQAVEYYRALEEQRRLIELQEQKEMLTEQLKTDAAKKLGETASKMRQEYREREQNARAYRKTRDEVNKLRRGIGRKVKRLNALRIRETDQRHVPQELQHVADIVMQTFTESSLSKLAFNPAQTASLARRYRMLQELENDMTYYWDDEIEQDIDNLQALGEAYTALREREGGVPSTLSLEGVELETEILQGVDAIVSNVLRMIDSENDQFLAKRNETFDAFATQTGEDLIHHKDAKILKGKVGDVQMAVDELLRTGNMTPIYFFEQLKNGRIMEVFDQIRRAQTEYARIIRVCQDFVQDVKERYHYGSWTGDAKLAMKTSQGHQITLSREQAMWVYATAKREKSNKLYQTEHLLVGGFQYKDTAGTGEGKFRATDKPHSLDEADIAKIGEWLTAEQKAYADEVVGFLSTTMADYGNDASMEMFGYKKFLEGYYFPFQTSAAQRFQRGDEGAGGDNAGKGRVKNSGFTKKLQHGANVTLIMDDFTTVAVDHMQKMATYAAMVQPIENMKRLMNHKVIEEDGTINTIRALIGQKYGMPAQKYLQDFLKDLNGAAQGDNRAIKGVDFLVSAFKRGAVMASASVVLQQPTAMARAMAMVNPKYFMTNPFYRPGKGLWDEMMKHSGTAVIKDMGKFDVGLGLTASEYISDEHLKPWEAYRRLKAESKLKGGMEAYKRFMDWLTAAPGKADQWTWGLIWQAVKKEVAEQNPGMDTSSEAFLDLVGQRFDDVIDHTQVYDSVLTRSNLMRSKNALHKMATSFMSEPTLSINMLYNAMTGEHSGKKRAVIIGSVIASQVLAGALAAVVQAWNDDDDERNWAEKYADRATGNILDNVNPLSMIPYISDLMSLFEGYSVERPDMSVVSDIMAYGKNYFKAFEDGGAPNWKQTENFIGTIANLTGLPAKNISREMRRTWNAITNTDWSAPNARNVGLAMLENVPFYSSKNSAWYERLVKAMLDGDKEQAEDIRTYMLTSKMVKEDTIDSGVKTALKNLYAAGKLDDEEAKRFLMDNGLVDDEDAAYWEVEKWAWMRETGGKAGDWRKYDDFTTAVESGENLKQVVQTYMDNGVTAKTLAAKITEEYKPRMKELYKTNKTKFANLQARILTAYQVLGYDRDKKLKDIQKWLEEP